MTTISLDDETYLEKSTEDLLKIEVFYNLGVEKTTETKQRLADTNTTRLYYHLLDGTGIRYYTDVPGRLGGYNGGNYYLACKTGVYRLAPLIREKIREVQDEVHRLWENAPSQSALRSAWYSVLREMNISEEHHLKSKIVILEHWHEREQNSVIQDVLTVTLGMLRAILEDRQQQTE